jgi:hypothetical protein
MSELTPCNRCLLNQIKRSAEAEGKTVTVERERLVDVMAMGSDRAWWICKVDGEHVASFMELTEGCAC